MNRTNRLKQGFPLYPKRVLVVSPGGWLIIFPVRPFGYNTNIKTSERMSHSLTFGCYTSAMCNIGFGLNNKCFSYFPFIS